MSDRLQAYQDAIAQQVHAICWDRNLNPQSAVNPEAACRIERFLPQLIGAARTAGAENYPAFEGNVLDAVCRVCGGLDAQGTCRTRAAGECCLYRYLPLVYDALQRVQAEPPS